MGHIRPIPPTSPGPDHDLAADDHAGHAPATRLGRALVARAVLRARIRVLLAEPALARAVAARLGHDPLTDGHRP